MSDIVTIWRPDQAAGDWLIAGSELDALLNTEGDGTDLYSAVLISIFSDARAAEDEVIPDSSSDRRGWWAGDIGSKLWLRMRSKATVQLLPIVKKDIEDALQWLIDDGVAAAIDVSVNWDRPGFLAGTVTVRRQDGSTKAINFQRVWESR
ncbi:MAG TPA: phage GP46 family protein [Sphingobium sp.]|uniref:phage GP46 family protein n=1 Tax=Sphingobium sp. TaxID=1912891 RepID=UPI002ED2A628